MSFTQIIDGTGSKKSVKVTDKFKLTTEATSITNIEAIAREDEESYVLSSGFVSLTTTGSFNGIMFIKGLDANTRFHIDRIRICGNGANGNLQVKVIANATAGTLISDANAGYSHNTVLGSSNELTGLYSIFAASGDGKTVTDGAWFAQYQQPSLGHSNQDYNGSIIIDKNTSFAVVAKPSVSCDICVEILGYKETI